VALGVAVARVEQGVGVTRATVAAAMAPTLSDTVAARLRTLRERSRELGPAYALTDLARRGARRVADRLENRLLAIEGARGVLGPAHRAFTRYEATGEREVWSGWDWSTGGEEWNESAEWKASLIEHVLGPSVPGGGVVLEIGPGAGRWTEHLRERADRLVLVEATDEVLDLTRRRYADDPAVSFVRTGGSDMPGVSDSSVDAVWSFDVFVHLAPLDTAGYLAEVARVLRPGGVATIHHSGGRNPRGWRAPMTARLFANLATERGLEVERQFDSWEGGRFDVRPFGDVVTRLRAPAHGVGSEPGPDAAGASSAGLGSGPSARSSAG